MSESDDEFEEVDESVPLCRCIKKWSGERTKYLSVREELRKEMLRTYPKKQSFESKSAIKYIKS